MLRDAISEAERLHEQRMREETALSMDPHAVEPGQFQSGYEIGDRVWFREIGPAGPTKAINAEVIAATWKAARAWKKGTIVPTDEAVTQNLWTVYGDDRLYHLCSLANIRRRQG